MLAADAARPASCVSGPVGTRLPASKAPAAKDVAAAAGVHREQRNRRQPSALDAALDRFAACR